MEFPDELPYDDLNEEELLLYNELMLAGKGETKARHEVVMRRLGREPKDAEIDKYYVHRKEMDEALDMKATMTLNAEWLDAHRRGAVRSRKRGQ